MNYLEARRHVIEGGRVRRAGWASDAFLLLVPGSTITVDADRPLGQAAPELVGAQVRYSAHVDLYRNGLLSPWCPPLDDVHADDWEIL